MGERRLINLVSSLIRDGETRWKGMLRGGLEHNNKEDMKEKGRRTQLGVWQRRHQDPVRRVATIHSHLPLNGTEKVGSVCSERRPEIRD